MNEGYRGSARVTVRVTEVVTAAALSEVIIIFKKKKKNKHKNLSLATDVTVLLKSTASVMIGER